MKLFIIQKRFKKESFDFDEDMVFVFEFKNKNKFTYSYSPLIKKSLNIENNNVNLQIAYKNDSSIIGWPLILGSF